MNDRKHNYRTQEDWQYAQNLIFDRMMEAIEEYETLGFDIKIEVRLTQEVNEFRDGGYYGKGNWH